jgi:NCAIR mutase (PurE)-related protein
MDRDAVEGLLEAVRRGDVAVGEAASRLAGVLPAVPRPPSGEVVSRVDHHRALRCGFPEVVFGEGKRADDLVRIAGEVLTRSATLLVTRVDAARARALAEAIPDAEHDERARTVTVRRGPRAPGRRGVVVVCAGTADVPVAEEARRTAEAMGEAPEALYDVGVAGLHRLLAHQETLRAARVLVVVAGMEGALPSVVGGLVAAPVIAVPTSVGYGTGVGGVAPLLTMLNSCAPNVCVVNVDNGFGAGYLASLVNRHGAPA